MQARAVELEDLQDLSVVADELDRLSRVSDRLIRMYDDTISEPVDIDRILVQSVGALGEDALAMTTDAAGTNSGEARLGREMIRSVRATRRARRRCGWR